jgi:hypothetical protein
MSIRGIDDQALTQLKSQAEHEGTSLNSLVLRLLQGAATQIEPGMLKKFNDLDALSSQWDDNDALDFERNTAAFTEVDAKLWS